MGRIAQIIGRQAVPEAEQVEKPKGFDDFELRLGDLMRGERATQSKSLLDVQRELRIKASYIAAIENADISAFETPGFIAGFVRSYARYLGLDPDWAFEKFCREANFTPTHGMAPQASGPKKERKVEEYAEPLANPNAIFVPRGEAFLSRVQPRALGSVLVLALLAGGLGYGGWSVLQEVQRVRLAPVDTPPGVVAELDPLAAAELAAAEAPAVDPVATTTPEVMDRLYRPDALDVPVLVARDGPIAAIDPNATGALAGMAQIAAAPQPAAPAAEDPAVRTVEAEAPPVEILAVRPAWVRVQSADGTIIFEKVLDAGERYAIPRTEEPPVLRAGNSGSVYFAVNGQTYGPASPGSQVVKNLKLSPEALTSTYAVADLSRDADLAKFVDVAENTVPVDQIPTD